MKNLYLLFMALTLTACLNSNNSPEKALENYIHAVSSGENSKDFYLEHTTSELRENIESMTDEEFRDFVSLPKISGKKFKVITKTCNEDKCTLTYLLTYTSGENKEFKNEIKKIAVLIRVEDEWKIASASNLKTFIEARKDLLINQ